MKCGCESLAEKSEEENELLVFFLNPFFLKFSSGKCPQSVSTKCVISGVTHTYDMTCVMS